MLISDEQVELVQSSVVVNNENLTVDVTTTLKNKCNKKVKVTMGCIISLSGVSEEEQNAFINTGETLLLERGGLPILYHHRRTRRARKKNI